MKNFYVSTYYDNQVPIISIEGFDRDGTIEGETLMINQRKFNLTDFRRKYNAITRRKAICNFIYPDECMGWEDYSAKEWEKMLAEKLS